MTTVIAEVQNTNSEFKSPYMFKGVSLNNITEQFKSKDISQTENKNNITQIQEKLGEPHPFDYDLIGDLVKKFGLTNAILDKYTDFVIGPGLYIESENDSVIQVLDDWMKETNFKFFLPGWFKEAMAKGSSYLEIADFENVKAIPTIKIINPKSIYVKRDVYGTILAYNQYLGQVDNNRISSINDVDVTELPMNDIIQLDINKFGNEPYGQGILYSSLDTINNFLMAQKSIHFLTKRKANVPVHAKLGDAEKGDYPSQGDIDAFGQLLVDLRDSTEWVTGPNVEMKVIDFGNIGDKFITILDNDYKLLSFAFQVPEAILGAGNIAEGLGKVQMEGFERRIKALQDAVTIVLKSKIFDVILANKGIKVDYKITWGQADDEMKNMQIDVLKNVLALPTLSPELRVEIERKLAGLIGLDVNKIEFEEPEEQPMPEDKEPVNKEPVNKEPSDEEAEDFSEDNLSDTVYTIDDYMKKVEKLCRGPYKDIREYSMPSEHLHSSDDMTIQEWTQTQYRSYTDSIIKVIENDNFDFLRATTKTELKAGYLSQTKINRLKKVMIDGFENNKRLSEITRDVKEKVNIKPLLDHTNRRIIKDEKGRKIILLDKEARIDMIVRTEIVRLSAKGFLEQAKEDKTKLVIWNAVVDGRVCPLCEELNGKIFEVASISQQPPIHVNCRCVLERVKTTEEKVKNILEQTKDNKLSPQEAEIKIQKEKHISEKQANKLVEAYIRLDGRDN